MSTNHQPSEAESRAVAEASRETEWKEPSFLKELYLGSFRFNLIDPFPGYEDRAEFLDFYDRVKKFIKEKVDSTEIDRTGEYPKEVLDGLRELGCFGMKIPKKYGGLGLTQTEYDKVMKLLGSADGNISALLSAHQSIGVPQPIKLFGTEEQKKKFLPRCAKGAISAFALTEPDVGSDPAALQTTCELNEDGTHYTLNGYKLWCTNGTLAELLVVMARHPNTRKISAFIVEADSPGVHVEHRCRFMGLKALANAVIRLENVQVPKENLVGGEGKGLKIALVTLNTGRLALPAGCVGGVKASLEITRRWANDRVQWGFPVGKHEAISHKIADMAATTFAMEAVSDLASRLADRGGYDIRLEAAAAKEFNSVRAWEIIDDTMQIRGGRGYETEQSLKDRGEAPIPVERAMRDARINRIFEGSSEIMHLFIAREAVDVHLQIAGAIIEGDAKAKLQALPKIAAFYGAWYPSRWAVTMPWAYGEYGRLGQHLRYAEKATRKLAREMFHGMALFQAKLQRKQAFLFRAVDIGLYLFAMSAAISRATHMKRTNHPEARYAEEIADLFARNARQKVDEYFRQMWHNHDDFKNKVARDVLAGKYAWLEEGQAGLEKLYAQQPAPQAKKNGNGKSHAANGKSKTQPAASEKTEVS
jgi:alkylation response protein AidB-like acyl-CoA dehydrogenase